MLSTNQKGAIAEASIAREAIRLGIGVFKPLTDERADFVFDVGHRLLRIQCKWAVKRDTVVTVLCYSSRRTSSGIVRRLYSSNEIDAYAAYCAELDKCYYLPMELFAGRSQIQLRLAPTLNGQDSGINWARHYELPSMLAAIAA
jgi:hypothetical protein